MSRSNPGSLAHNLESKHTIDMVQFVRHCEIDPRFFDKPYYVIPNDSQVAMEGFSVIRDALRSTKKVALGQMAWRGRDYIVAIKPCGSGLLLESLRFADEIRASDTVFQQIPNMDVDDEMLQLASELIERKSKPFEPSAFTSQYFGALRELIKEKRETGEVKGASDEELGVRGDNVIDLMSALKNSVARDKRTTGKARDVKRARKATPRKSPARKKAAGGRSR